MKKSGNPVQMNAAATLKHMTKSRFTPLFELVTNALEEGKVEATAEERGRKKFLIVKNTGKPVQSLEDLFGIEHASDDYEPDNATNHLRSMGFPLSVCYAASKTATATVYSRYGDHCVKATVDYRKMTWTAEEFPTSEWEYGKWTTVVEVPIERPKMLPDDAEVLRALGKKYAVALINGGHSIKWNGQDVKPVFHAPVVGSADIDSFWIDAEGIINKSGIRYERRKNGRIASVLRCPAINGFIEVFWQKAERCEGASDTAGITVFNNGVMVERTGLKIIANNSTYGNKDKEFRAIPQNRFECNSLAAYVNFCPGPGVEMPFTGDKESIDWFTDPVGIKLQRFLDDRIGHKFREVFRLGNERRDRKMTDALLRAFGDFYRTNQAFIKEVSVLGKDGKIRQIADGVMLRVTVDNEKKIESYIKRKAEGRRGHYILDENDFSSESTRKHRMSDVQVVEYKALERPRILDADVMQVVSTIDTITRTMGIERSAIHGILLGGDFDDEIKDVIRYKEETDGYVLSYCQYSTEGR